MVPLENLHLTLKFIGEVDEGKAKEIAEALAAVKFAPFPVSLAGGGAYPSLAFPRAIWVGGKSPGAEELARRIDDALAPLGLKKEKFSVHLTVARAGAKVDLGAFVKTGKVGAFEVRAFALMKSTLAPSGAAYEVLREYAAEE
ncbi:RNA 2',3'-cyclic phosphodiesterase [uncultured archaeon]|nr:RNA 2',3'-cyclic phosphodiesterase [uncultured archaeon]